jgi:glycosyltransferase involved in cell wall biosynthesis
LTSRRLLILTASELTRDPRARRAAARARDAGIDVVGVSGQISGESPAPLEAVRVVRVGRTGTSNPAWERAREHRRGAVRREVRGIFRLARLLLRTAGLVRAARRQHPYGTVHANDLDTLPAGWLAAHAAGARLVYDAHELYSEFETDPPRLARRAALALERSLARRADAVITVSPALAVELERRLDLRTPPLVVLNAPDLPASDPPETSPGRGLLRVVYLGAFGSGRPLEDLLEALAAAAGVHLTIRVVRTSAEEIRAAAVERGVAERVEAAPPLPPGELVEGLRSYEVGIVFDRPATRNAEVSLPNKLFEYLAAGLAVVVPRLRAMAELVEETGAGMVYDAGSPSALASALTTLAADRDLVETYRRRAREAAAASLNANAQSEALLAAWGF